MFIETSLNGIYSNNSSHNSNSFIRQNPRTNFSSVLNQHLESSNLKSSKLESSNLESFKQISQRMLKVPIENANKNAKRDNLSSRLENPKQAFSTESVRSSKDRLKELSHEFESLLISQMLKSMKRTLNKEPSLFHGGQTEKLFDELLDEQYALEISKSSQLGLADSLYRELTARI